MIFIVLFALTKLLLSQVFLGTMQLELIINHIGL